MIPSSIRRVVGGEVKNPPQNLQKLIFLNIIDVDFIIKVLL